MRKISLVFAIVVLLVGIPVQAQKKNRPIIQPPPPGIRPVGVLIQADNGEGYMTVDFRSAAFTCYLCEYNYAFKGVGEVKIDGCNVYFSVITDDYSMFATINMCDHQAKCAVEVFNDPNILDFQPFTEYLTDSNLLDSTPDCVLEIKK